jgi:hypothetical protein
MKDALALVDSHQWLVPAGLAAIVALVLWIGMRVRRSGRHIELMDNVIMLVGLGWSSEAVWHLTKKIPDFPVQLRYLIFFVLEALLLQATTRAARYIRTNGRPGRSARTAWIVAIVMALVALFVAGSVAEALLRAAVPLLIVKSWWDGLVGEEYEAAEGTWRWTPRRLLLWLGAIEPGANDFEKVNRKRLVQQLVRLDRLRSNAEGRRRTRYEGKLTKLSERADAEIIAEVRQQRGLSNWWTVTPLTQHPATHPDAGSDAPVAQHGDAPVAQHGDAPVAQVAIAPNRRAKSVTQVVTSGDARDADPATRAAHLVLTQGLSKREAARRIPGATDPTVRRRVKELRDAADDAPNDADLTHPQTNGYPVLTGSTE